MTNGNATLDGMHDGYWALIAWILTGGTVDRALLKIGCSARDPRPDQVDSDAAEMARLKQTMTYKEIAEMYGMSVPGVWQRISRYKKACMCDRVVGD